MRVPVAGTVLLAAAAISAFAAPPPASLLSRLELPVKRHVLGNGMVVLTMEDHSVPTVTFWQVFRVGSRNERPGITGISHFFEHMMFNGSENVPPKEYDRIIEAAGGASNAFTDLDVTAYEEEIASDRLDVLLRLDADRLRGLSLLPDVLKSEVEVVKEERRSGTDDSPFGLLNEQLYATALVASPYRTPIIGYMKDLERITRDEMAAYFRTYYAPNNGVLVLTGDFDTEKALAAIRAAFEPIPRQEPPAEPVDAEPPPRGEKRVAVSFPSETVSFQIGYQSVAGDHPDAAALEVLEVVLADGPSSRLVRELVRERELAIDAGASFDRRIHPDLFQIYVELLPGKTFEDGLAAVDAVLAKLKAEGPSARELSRAQNVLEANAVRGIATNTGLGIALGMHEILFGDWRDQARFQERVLAVTAEDCRRVARRILDAKRRTVAFIVPEGDEAPGDEVEEGP